MKFFVLLLLIAQTTIATEWENSFNEGNKAYKEGKYEESVNFYMKIIENNIESGEVFFNLGNAYYKLDEIGRAILYYEKAEKYLSGDEALLQNLQITRLKIIDEIEPIPKLFLINWWKKITYVLTLENFGWLTLFLFVIFTAFVSVYILLRKRLLLKMVLISALLFSLISIFYISRIYEFETTKFGIIFDKKISIMSEPGLGSSELFILHEGTKVKIKRNIDDWYEISIADGKIGWCKSYSIGII